MEPVTISLRTLALLATAANMPRLRVAHLTEPEVYDELNLITNVAYAYRISRSRQTQVTVVRGPLPPLTTKEAANHLGIKHGSVIRAVNRGFLPATRVGRDLFIAPEDLAAYKARRAGRAHRVGRRGRDVSGRGRDSRDVRAEDRAGPQQQAAQ